jgi:uncharacterized protein (TIGR02271 family)
VATRGSDRPRREGAEGPPPGQPGGGEIYLHEERLEVGKRRIESSAGALRKRVLRERRSVKVPVFVETAITLSRRPPAARRVAALLDESPEVVVPLFREEVRLTAVPKVYERVRLVRTVERTTEQVREEVRREELVEERKELGDEHER